MKKIVVLVCLLFLQSFIHAQAPAQPPVITGTIGKDGDAKVAATLGHNGVLFIRTEARWDEFRKLLPDLTPNTPLRPLIVSARRAKLYPHSGAAVRSAHSPECKEAE